MAKVLFICLPFHGHVNPTLGLVKLITDQGHRVDYILTEHYRNKIEQAGGRLLPVDIGFDMDALTLNVFNVATDMMLVKMFLKIHRRAKAEIPKYDCVIYDSLIFSGESLTKEAKKTGICSITTFAVSESIAADFVSFNRFFDRILRNRIVRRSITRILNRTILKELNIQVKDFWDLFKSPSSGTKVVYTSRRFQIRSEDFDESFLFLGPSITDRLPDSSFPFEKLRGKLIYISLGTIANTSANFFSQCIEAFADFPATIVISVGKRVSMERFKSIPDNILMFHFVPQLETLQHTDVFITHGGMNSVNESLFYGVPMIVVPQALDQSLVAKRVCELGVGLTIEKGKANAAALRGATLQILENPQYKEKCVEFKSSFQSPDRLDISDAIHREKRSAPT